VPLTADPSAAPDAAGLRGPNAQPGAGDPAGHRSVRGAFTDLAGPGEGWWQGLRSAGLRSGWPHDRSVTRLVAVAVAAALVGAAAVWAMSATTSTRGSGGAAGLPLATRRSAPGTAEHREPVGGSPSTTVVEPATTVAGGWVAVAGAVVRPGLYRAATDTRVSSLLAAAGGLAPDADPDRVNLAAPVRDGERVYVPRRGEAGAPPVVAGTGGGPDPAPPAAGAGPAGARGGAPAGPVDLNRATAAELDALPGVGPTTAQAIIEHRATRGPFTSVEQLADVRGIGPAKLDHLRPLVVV
jgi:competence protein ComEA